MPGSNAGSVDAAMRSRRVTGMSLSLDENLRTASVAGGNKLCSCRMGQCFDDAASSLLVLVRRLRALEVQPIPDRETRGLAQCIDVEGDVIVTVELVTPGDAEGIVVPRFEVAGEIGIVETKYEVPVFNGHARSAVEVVVISAAVIGERQRRFATRFAGGGELLFGRRILGYLLAGVGQQVRFDVVVG